MKINWYPGHMASAKRMLCENLRLIDIAILMLDARIPYSSRNPDLDRLLENKQVLTVLNKADLADPALTKEWVEEFRAKGHEVMAVCGRSVRRADILAALERLARPAVEKARARGMNKTVRVLCAGVPNVGKSTLINTLAGSARARTGDRAGVTRGKQWIRINDRLELLDSPGLLWPRLDNQTAAARLAITGALNDEILDKEELALELIKQVSAAYPENLAARYGVAVSDAPLETYESICLARGLLLKGGQPDFLRGAVMLIDEYRSGKIGRMTLDLPFARLSGDTASCNKAVGEDKEGMSAHGEE